MLFKRFPLLFSLLISCLLFSGASGCTSVVDVMILYTPKRAEHVKLSGTSLQDYSDQIIRKANEVYTANGVEFQLRLVHVAQIDRENTEIEGGVSGIGKLPEVRRLRDHYRADLVSLMIFSEPDTEGAKSAAQRAAEAQAVSCFTREEMDWIRSSELSSPAATAKQGLSLPSAPKDAGHCTGTGLIPNDLERTGRVSSSMAFSMSNQFCDMNPPLVFLHELGHNMGLAHARAMDTNSNRSPRSFEHGYGYGVLRFFSTIMGYPDRFLAPRIPQFSDPTATCPGDHPCGIPQSEPDSADAVSALNSVAPYIAGFYMSRDGISVGPPSPSTREPGNLLRNPDFESTYDETTGEFVIHDWEAASTVADDEPYALLLPGEILDLDRRTYEVEAYYRSGADVGVSQALDPALIQPSTSYRVSALLLIPYGGEGVVDRGFARLVVRTAAPEAEHSYEISGEVSSRQYKNVSGVITTDAWEGTVVDARIVYTIADPELELAVVRPYLGRATR
jgi:hypothetical protein